ncbi:MAG TPA: helix-turn-helix domain-containing protein [Solirubrobacterales bacterium]|nr:helix-turn-helix domain-containing protein [Solirubrobacterales bacterium]
MDSSSASNPRSVADRRRGLPQAYVVRSQRERLLEAMVRVAAAKGYEATTIADVAEFAGVSESAFHQLFASKEECFLEAYDAVIDVLVAHVASAFEAAAGEPWPERIGAGLRALVELLAAEAEIARMAMVEVTAAGEKARERYRAALARFTPFLEEGRMHSGQGDELPPDTARFAIGGATSMIFDEVRAGRGPELVRLLPDIVFAVLMPYLGAEAAEDEMRRLARQG